MRNNLPKVEFFTLQFSSLLFIFIKYCIHNVKHCNSVSDMFIMLSRNCITLRCHRFAMHFNAFQFSASAATVERDESEYFHISYRETA